MLKPKLSGSQLRNARWRRVGVARWQANPERRKAKRQPMRDHADIVAIATVSRMTHYWMTTGIAVHTALTGSMKTVDDARMPVLCAITALNRNNLLDLGYHCITEQNCTTTHSSVNITEMPICKYVWLLLDLAYVRDPALVQLNLQLIV